MFFRISLVCTEGVADVSSKQGLVTFNGADLLPHEALRLANALTKCAEEAEKKAAALVRLQKVAA